MKNITRILICLSVFAGWGTATSGDFVNSKPLLKDSVSTNPGLEVISPLMNFRDTNLDGYPDRVVFAYNV